MKKKNFQSKLAIAALSINALAMATSTSSMPKAAATTSGAVSTQKAQASAVTKAKFAIDDNDELSVAFLDKCWANREDTTNQTMIADYLMTKPKIPNDFETAWKLSRLVYFIGNYGIGENRFVHTSDGVKLFRYGADAGEIAKKLNPSKVEGYYWYAIDLGSYGLASGILKSASNAGSGMDALKVAMQIDPAYQWYGSSRILGKYYQELPGLFGGSSKKALALITSATTNAGKFSNNWVFLGQYYISQKDYDNAKIACGNALKTKALDGKYEEMRYRREARECLATQGS